MSRKEIGERAVRFYRFEKRDAPQANGSDVLEGYAAVFNQTADIGGMFAEKIDPHAFDKCDFTDTCLLVNHDDTKLALARSRGNTPNSTLQLKTDQNGLFIHASLDTENNTEAKNLYSAVSRGDVDKMSFAFIVDSDTWENQDTDYPMRTINSISKVYEVSAVNFPAYDSTTLGARGFAETLESDKKALECARSAFSLESGKRQDYERRRDEILKKIESALK